MSLIQKDDVKYIKRCFILAKRGQGKVSPNPLVGAVLVKNGKITGEGWHKKYGQAHAEVIAFKNAKGNVSGSTLYVNLEPCCHTKKKTPPCVPLILLKKVKRVVISNEDPNPEVAGQGIAQLRSAGIQITTDVCSKEGIELNKFYINYVRTQLPYIILKIAQSIDGKIGITNQEQKWLTGDESRKFVHQMRARCDAVLIGANTVRVDDPQLSVRDVKGQNPIRVIIDGKLSIPINSQILQSNNTNQTIIFTDNNSDSEKITLLKNRDIEVVQLEEKNGVIDIYSILKILSKRKIISLFVEGGQRIFSQFINKELFDEIVVLQAPQILGEGISAFCSGYQKKLFIHNIDTLGSDTKIVLRKIKS